MNNFLFTFLLFCTCLNLFAEQPFTMLYEEAGHLYVIQDKKSKHCGKLWSAGKDIKDGQVLKNFCWQLNNGMVTLKEDSLFTNKTVQIPWAKFHSILEPPSRKINPVLVDMDGEPILCSKMEGDPIIHCRR